MRFKLSCFVLLVLAAISVCSARMCAQVVGPSSSYSRLPLTFEANQGQANPQVKFLSRGRGYTASLTAGGIVLSLRPAEVIPFRSGTRPQSKRSSDILQFNLVGAAANPVVIGEDPQPGRVNYFIGNDKSKWRTNVPTFGKVRYKNVYPGIDLVYYGNHRQLEYDFAISPGADSSVIQFEIKGSREIEIDPEGSLVLKTNHGQLRFQSPAIYQESNGSRVPLPGKYVLKRATRVGFQVANVDPKKPLVIDPVLIYSTYLGGSGNDQPTGIAVDGNGNIYVAGFTDSADFPLATLGSLTSGTDHVFVAKFNSTGSNLVYADYIGGNSQDYGYALTLDSTGEAYVTGSTASSNFPVVSAFQGTYPGAFNAFLTKISTDGSSLLYSTYLGGNGSDLPTSIALDGSSNILVAGNTSSTNFPVVNGFQSTVSPNQGGYYGTYGFITKFTADGSSLVYSTYLGGSSNVPYNCNGTPCWGSPFTGIQSMALDAGGNAYVAGGTNTYNFPATPGAYSTSDTTQLNATVGFVSKFSGAGTLDYSTYFYETSGLFTNLDAIAVDASGSAYVTGSAYSDGTFPITSTSICNQSVYGIGCSYAFVTKFDPSAATLVYSTFLGPNNYGIPAVISLDQNNDAYVLASTSSNSFGIVNGMEAYAGGNDILLVEIDPVAGSELLATYLGGSADERAAAMAIDSSGNIYVTGTTDSTDFPTTQGAFQGELGGNTDAFVMKIGAASAPSVSLTPYALQYSSVPVGSTSQPQQVLLRDMGSAALTLAISVTGDFAETDNCSTSVLAAGSCSVSVTFAPAAVGPRTGSLVFTDNAVGSPHTVALSGIGLPAPVVSLTPAILTFPNTPVGLSSATQTVTLFNQGTASLTVSRIQVSGDFGQTNNCPNTLSTGASCTFNVMFTPTAAGTRSGALTITDNASGSPHAVALSGVGLGSPVVSLTPASLTFPNTQVGVSSVAQMVTLLNQGNASLNISGIQISGDFGQTNNCPNSLSAGASCTFNVIFTPTASGGRSGSLTIADNASNSQQVVGLTGSGLDFSIGSSQSSVTVKSGSVATYTLTVAPLGGAFNSVVKISCGKLPPNAACGFSPASVTPGTNSSTVTLKISTSGTSTANRQANQLAYATLLGFSGFGALGMIVVSSKRMSNRSSMLIVLALIVLAFLGTSGCAGGTGIVPTGNNTPPGTYAVTVTGASGNLQHAASLTLIVQ